MCSSASRELAICFLSSPHYWSALSLGKKEYSGRTTYWELKSVCWLKSVSPQLSKEAVFNGKKKEHWHNKRLYKYTPNTQHVCISWVVYTEQYSAGNIKHKLITLKWAHTLMVGCVTGSECSTFWEISDLSVWLLTAGLGSLTHLYILLFSMFSSSVDWITSP